MISVTHHTACAHHTGHAPPGHHPSTARGTTPQGSPTTQARGARSAGLWMVIQAYTRRTAYANSQTVRSAHTCNRGANSSKQADLPAIVPKPGPDLPRFPICRTYALVTSVHPTIFRPPISGRSGSTRIMIRGRIGAGASSAAKGKSL